MSDSSLKMLFIEEKIHSLLFSFLLICIGLSCLVSCLEFVLTVAGDIWKPFPLHGGIEKIGGFVCPSFCPAFAHIEGG